MTISVTQTISFTHRLFKARIAWKLVSYNLKQHCDNQWPKAPEAQTYRRFPLGETTVQTWAQWICRMRTIINLQKESSRWWGRKSLKAAGDCRYWTEHENETTQQVQSAFTQRCISVAGRLHCGKKHSSTTKNMTKIKVLEMLWNLRGRFEADSYNVNKKQQQTATFYLGFIVT